MPPEDNPQALGKKVKQYDPVIPGDVSEEHCASQRILLKIAFVFSLCITPLWPVIPMPWVDDSQCSMISTISKIRATNGEDVSAYFADSFTFRYMQNVGPGRGIREDHKHAWEESR